MVYRGLIRESGLGIKDMGAQSNDSVLFQVPLGNRVCHISEVSLGVRVVMGSLMGSVCRSEEQGLWSHLERSGSNRVLWGHLWVRWWGGSLRVCLEAMSDVGVKRVSWIYYRVKCPQI